MRYLVVACGVFEPYLKELSKDCSNRIDLKALDAGLHSKPNELRLTLQEAIDEASEAGIYDGVIVLYGLCGMGTANLESRQIPVAIPRAHDCITLFLGSQEAYQKQFNENPGTFYHTLGWIDKKVNPKNRQAADIYFNYGRDDYGKHPEFDHLAGKYGEDNARHIIDFTESWTRNYSRAAYIDLGFPAEESYKQFTSDMADIYGWKHEVIKGEPELMRRLVSGEWDDDRVFVLPPWSRSAWSGDERIFAPISLASEDDGELVTDREIVLEDIGHNGQTKGIGLGIDAGGTYTDAVVYDLAKRKRLAKAKALTTHHNLLEGIRNVLAQLPKKMLDKVQVTALSTTLATNSVVEGRGCKVGVIAISPWDWTEAQIGHSPLLNVKGAVSIAGEVIEELDEAEVREAFKRLVEDEKCEAVVIGGYAHVRNPSLARQAAKIGRECYDIPVVCSHEISHKINAIHAAQTAIANAKLIPVIRELLHGVRTALEEFGVAGRLLVVKGDGTPVDESVARERPVETILSGPAASVAGAKILTGLDDALVIDVGGTTTDCAIIENGHVSVSPEGARIGNWVMSVDAVEIRTVGLGGDSRIDFTRDRKVTVGPVRNLPFAYAAHEHPAVLEHLKKFNPQRYKGEQDASALDVLVLNRLFDAKLTPMEEKLLELLASGPISSTRAALMLGLASHILLPVASLESKGLIRRCALTPTDLLHVTGKFTRWSVEASKLALDAFAVMFGQSPEEVLDAAMTAVTRRLFEELVMRELTWENRRIADDVSLSDVFMNKAFQDDGGALQVKFALRRPVVAIGAPAEALVPSVSERVEVQIVVPEDADVANAVGAIGSEITVREEALIRPGYTSNYVVHSPEGFFEFNSLERATDKSLELARSRAMASAMAAGAKNPGVKVSRQDRLGSATGGSKVFLERKVTAVATGSPFGE